MEMTAETKAATMMENPNEGEDAILEEVEIDTPEVQVREGDVMINPMIGEIDEVIVVTTMITTTTQEIKVVNATTITDGPLMVEVGMEEIRINLIHDTNDTQMMITTGASTTMGTTETTVVRWCLMAYRTGRTDEEGCRSRLSRDLLCSQPFGRTQNEKIACRM